MLERTAPTTANGLYKLRQGKEDEKERERERAYESDVIRYCACALFPLQFAFRSPHGTTGHNGSIYPKKSCEKIIIINLNVATDI